MVSCSHCVDCDLCCRHLSMEIDIPETDEEFENIRWYLLHENVKIWISEDEKWHIEFKTNCTSLNPDGLCNIYESRPNICRNYESEDCEKHGEYWEKMFKTPQDLEKYLKEKSD